METRSSWFSIDNRLYHILSNALHGGYWFEWCITRMSVPCSYIFTVHIFFINQSALVSNQHPNRAYRKLVLYRTSDFLKGDKTVWISNIRSKWSQLWVKKMFDYLSPWAIVIIQLICILILKFIFFWRFSRIYLSARRNNQQGNSNAQHPEILDPNESEEQLVPINN